MVSAEAVNEYTVHIHMAMPNNAMQYGLTTAFLQPLPRAYIEQVGDEEFGRHPIGAGPYKFKEWVTGEKIVLERNPEFDWGPPYSRGGPPFIETIEFRIIPEYSTRLAGLEAGEIDFGFPGNKDLDRIRDMGQFQILQNPVQSAGPYVLMNVSQPPFHDVRVRQAFNLTVDREVLIKAVLDGHGEPAYGPITPATFGYWPGVEYVGYGHDLEKARALMSDAGYTAGSDGILEKDGQRLKLVLKVFSSYIKAAEILKEQFEALGVELEIEVLEYGVWVDTIQSGDYQLGLRHWIWSEATILQPLFFSGTIGFMNEGRVSDPQLDQILVDVMAATSPESWQDALNEAQRYIVEQAYVAPLYAITAYGALNKRIKGATYRPKGGWLELFDAYIETTAP
jgi:peptide/nickel transport system substrate-binding protein